MFNDCINDNLRSGRNLCLDLDPNPHINLINYINDYNLYF